MIFEIKLQNQMKKLINLTLVLILSASCSNSSNDVVFVASGVEVTRMDLFHQLNWRDTFYPEYDSEGELKANNPQFHLFVKAFKRYNEETVQELIDTNHDLYVLYESMLLRKNFEPYMDSLNQINPDLYHLASYYRNENRESIQYLKENNIDLYNYIMGLKLGFDTKHMDALKDE